MRRRGRGPLQRGSRAAAGALAAPRQLRAAVHELPDAAASRNGAAGGGAVRRGAPRPARAPALRSPHSWPRAAPQLPSARAAPWRSTRPRRPARPEGPEARPRAVSRLGSAVRCLAPRVRAARVRGVLDEDIFIVDKAPKPPSCAELLLERFKDDKALYVRRSKHVRPVKRQPRCFRWRRRQLDRRR